MTLKEKFDTPIMRHDLGRNEIEETKEQCAEIAEEFAIGFAEFSINYNYHPMHKVWIRYDKMINEKFTTKQLLEIYKKEKGL